MRSRTTDCRCCSKQSVLDREIDPQRYCILLAIAVLSLMALIGYATGGT